MNAKVFIDIDLKIESPSATTVPLTSASLAAKVEERVNTIYGSVSGSALGRAPQPADQSSEAASIALAFRVKDHDGADEGCS